jgi:hypothetical protein
MRFEGLGRTYNDSPAANVDAGMAAASNGLRASV